MAIKKIVISPDNTKAIALFEDLNSKKEEMLKKIDKMQTNKFAKKSFCST